MCQLLWDSELFIREISSAEFRRATPFPGWVFEKFAMRGRDIQFADPLICTHSMPLAANLFLSLKQINNIQSLMTRVKRGRYDNETFSFGLNVREFLCSYISARAIP
jgi:hypothetical protein